MEQNPATQTAYLASGCFWDTQYHLNKIEGCFLLPWVIWVERHSILLIRK